MGKQSAKCELTRLWPLQAAAAEEALHGCELEMIDDDCQHGGNQKRPLFEVLSLLQCAHCGGSGGSEDKENRKLEFERTTAILGGDMYIGGKLGCKHGNGSFPH